MVETYRCETSFSRKLEALRSKEPPFLNDERLNTLLRVFCVFLCAALFGPPPITLSHSSLDCITDDLFALCSQASTESSGGSAGNDFSRRRGGYVALYRSVEVSRGALH